MRLVTVILVLLLALIQYSLWFGKGGWLRVWELEQQITETKEKNQKLRDENAQLENEVKDLVEGKETIEEIARSELGMIKQDEVFVQTLDDKKKKEGVKEFTKEKAEEKNIDTVQKTNN